MIKIYLPLLVIGFLLSQYPYILSQQETAEALYYKGLQAERESIDKAIEFYQKARENVQDNQPLKEKILLRLASCYEKKEEFAQARSIYQELGQKGIQKAKMCGIDYLVQLFKKAKGLSPEKTEQAKQQLSEKITKLYQQFSTDIVLPLLKYSLDVDSDVREVCSEKFEEIVNSDVVRVTIQLMNSEDPSVSRGAVWLISRFFSKYADAQRIQEIIDELNEKIQLVKIFEIGEVPEKLKPLVGELKSQQYIEKLLEHKNMLESQKNAILEKIEINIDEIMPELASAIETTTNEETLCVLIKTIGVLGHKTERIEDKIIEFVHHSNPNIQITAIEALRNMKSVKAVDTLTGILETEKRQAFSHQLRQKAVEALSEIEDVSALKNIIHALEDDFDNVKLAAGNAVNKFSGLGLRFNPGNPQEYQKQLEVVREWFEQTGGVDFLLEKIYKFALRWSEFHPVYFYHPNLLIDELEFERRPTISPEILFQMVNLLLKKFQDDKEKFIRTITGIARREVKKLIQMLYPQITVKIEKEIPFIETPPQETPAGVTTSLFKYEKDKKYGTFTAYIIADIIAELLKESSEYRQEILDILGKTDSPEQIGAAVVIARTPALWETALSGLERILKESKDVETLIACAYALGEIKTQQTAIALSEGVSKSDNHLTQAMMLKALDAIDIRSEDKQKVAGSLCNFIKKPAGNVESLFGKYLAVKIIGKIGAPEHIDTILPLRVHIHPKLSQQVAQAIQEIAGRNTAVRQILREKVNSDRYLIRRASIRALADIQDKEAIDILVKKLVNQTRDTDWMVRIDTIKSIEALAPNLKVVAEALIGALKDDPSIDVQKEANEALYRISKFLKIEIEKRPIITSSREVEIFDAYTAWREWYKTNQDKFE